MNEINTILIEGTAKTPQIELNHLSGDLIFSGKSIPENAAKVYEPVLNWAALYIQKARPVTNLRLNLEYFNTSSLLWLTKILRVLIQIKDPDYVFIVNLYMTVEEFDEIDDFNDIKDTFLPISNLANSSVSCIGIKLYGTDEKGEIVKETIVFMEPDQFVNTKSA
jgi:hypothetical protein